MAITMAPPTPPPPMLDKIDDTSIPDPAADIAEAAPPEVNMPSN